ncbi:DUF1214 domain-containing protein [Acrocarpospora catenulata]|uniref:DUF1214 domain-containing protein n=1 Tax=Acrocarpospora catenulata TaxID=2836182 RepID=UPI001BD9ED5E|nr:DUF1214 domain-containing protein [Acrocarpospora catenulata]
MPGDDTEELWRAWEDFCVGLGAKLAWAGAEILDRDGPELDRVEGLRVLLRDMRMSVERAVEYLDRDFPFFGDGFNDTYHLIGDAPDYTLQLAYVDGDAEYVIRGRAGTADCFTFTSQGPAPGSPDPGVLMKLVDPTASAAITGTLDSDAIPMDPDGHFEVTVSRAPPASGAWLPLAPNSTMILVRNEFHGRFTDHRRHRPAKLTISRRFAPERPAPLRAAGLRRGLDQIVRETGTATVSRGRMFAEFQRRGVGFDAAQDRWKAGGGNPRTVFLSGFWELAPGQALVVEVDDPPKASFWLLGLTNAWMESLDFRFHQMYLNSTTATVGPDGGLRFVVAAEDPGVPNWLDTAGHERGVLMWRWTYPERPPPIPRVRPVRLSDLVRKHPT